jgi:hypothetical protein
MTLEPFLRKSLDLPSPCCPNQELLAKLHELAYGGNHKGIPSSMPKEHDCVYCELEDLLDLRIPWERRKKRADNLPGAAMPPPHTRTDFSWTLIHSHTCGFSAGNYN